MKDKLLIGILGAALSLIGNYAFESNVIVLIVLGNVLMAIGFYRKKFELVSFICFCLSVLFSAVYTLIAVIEHMYNI